MKKIFFAILLAVCTLSFTACEKYLDVNNNVDAPDHIDGYLYLAGILSNYQGAYWDIRATGPLTQMMGTTNSTYITFANQRYYPASDAAGETWRYVYWLHGVNLENMINQSIEAENWTLAGIGYAIKAFDWDALTKLHGEAPMKQAYEPGRLNHEYDYQVEIYPQIREWAMEAIKYLEMNDQTDYGNHLKDYDLVYRGDKTKWIKFAHSVIVANLASLTNKTNFTSAYAQELLQHAALGIQSNDENFVVEVGGGADQAQYSAYNNFWGIWRGNLTYGYFPHQWAVQVMTGTVPKYDEQTGELTRDVITEGDRKGEIRDAYYPYLLADEQIIADTTKVTGHFDPRVLCKISPNDTAGMFMWDVNDEDVVKSYKYDGGNITSTTSPVSGRSTATFYGSYPSGWTQSQARLGSGKWIYRDDAPYILMTASEIKMMVAETYWKMNQKADALAAWKEGVALDVEFTGNYLNAGSTAKDADGNFIQGGGLPGGVACSKAVYNKLAQEYLDGPYVGGMTLDKFTLSHIMMQKFVTLFPWGASEEWVDQRKYHYDIDFTGDVPSLNNGYTLSTVNQKSDSDPTKVFKGFYLYPANVQGRRSQYSADYNQGSPCYRLRPRYNSEYMWNKNSLAQLKPIDGNEPTYITSIPWFALPNE